MAFHGARRKLVRSFGRSPMVIVASGLLLAIFIGAAGAPWIAPHNPYDLARLDLNNALVPPMWYAEGRERFPLGTDNQGRDVLSTILYGTRISLGVGLGSVIVASVFGVTLGLIAGYFGRWVDAIVMRLADIQLAFPAILMALMLYGLARVIVPAGSHERLATPVLIAAIAASGWVQYARTVRGSTMVEKGKEYILAAHLAGRHPIAVLLAHILPNVLPSVLVLATLHVATAIAIEATLSFLGVGVPPTTPSLGTLVRSGNDFLFSGEWWIAAFPGTALMMLILSLTLFGDWLRDRLNPKLRDYP